MNEMHSSAFSHSDGLFFWTKACKLTHHTRHTEARLPQKCILLIHVTPHGLDQRSSNLAHVPAQCSVEERYF